LKLYQDLDSVMEGLTTSAADNSLTPSKSGLDPNMITPSKRVRKENVFYSDTTVLTKSKKKKKKGKGKSPMKAMKIDMKMKGGSIKIGGCPSKSRPKSKQKGRTELTIQTEIDAVQTRIQKLKVAKEKMEKSIEASIKYPVPDELITSIDKKGKPPAPLPEAFTKLNLSDSLISDALMVWDCLHMFSEQLQLFPMSLDDFVDLMSYTESPSVPLTEVCCALLKCILADDRLAGKVGKSIPKSVNFSHRHLSGPQFTLSELTIGPKEDLVDVNYNGLGLLPKQLCKELISPINWQTVLRCVLWRLPATKLIRDAVGERSDVEEVIPGITSPKWGRESVKTMKNIARFHNNMDLMNCVTSNLRVEFEKVSDASIQLQTKEFHELKAANKLTVLKVLCDSCYETEHFRSILARNAEERCERILKLNKTTREEQLKKREVSATKREQAIEQCRKINMAGAQLVSTDQEPNRKKSKKTDDSTVAESEATNSVSGRGKGKGTGKEEKIKNPFDPTWQQLQQMLDDIVMLDSFGIDGVESGPPDEADIERESDDDKVKVPVELLDMKDKILRRRRDMEKKKAEAGSGKSRVDREQLRKLRADARAVMEEALATKTDRTVKLALKLAKQAGYRWTGLDGRDICSELMKKVYRVQYDMDQSARDAAISRQHEKDLAEFFVRNSHVGCDRNYDRYFCFDGDPRLFVERRKLLTDTENFPTNKGITGIVSSRSFGDFAAALSGLLPPPPGLCDREEKNNITSLATSQLLKAKPSLFCSQWSVYASNSEMYQLCDALDERGERERELKTSLKARFEISEPLQAYQDSGHPYIGRKVVRTFGKSKKTTHGLIVGWLPAEEDDPPIWHVQHQDGDEEDLEEHELNLVPFEDEMEKTPPYIVDDYVNKIRGHNPIRSTQVGITGLRNDLLRIYGMIIEGLKMKGVKVDKTFPRDSRKLLESSIRNAEDIIELRRLVQSLEEVVHATQTVEDTIDEELREKVKEKYRAKMLDEGWLFANDPHKLVGKRCRRFFRSRGISDAIVVAYLSADLNEDQMELFYVEHDDGDQEDVDLLTATKAVKYSLEIAKECDDEDVIDDLIVDDDSNNSDDEEDSDAGTQQVEDDQDEEDYEEDEEPGVRLWPSQNVRFKWLSHLQASMTVSEVALALAALTDHVPNSYTMKY
jgi:hypothetical protein